MTSEGGHDFTHFRSKVNSFGQELTLSFDHISLSSDELSIPLSTPFHIRRVSSRPRVYYLTYLDHDETSLPESRALHGEGRGCSGISSLEIETFLCHREYGG